MELDYLSAFIIGLLGSGHCLSMCGGISTMLTSALPNQASIQSAAKIFGYNFGRIFSYTLIGAIAGFTSSLAVKSIGVPILTLKIIAGIFLILLGLYIGQWFMLLSKVEIIGKFLWRRISPFTQQLLPINTVKKSIFLGMLWGWLPCGLVYSTLTWSMASGTTIDGALIMFFFGLGTLPALFTMSFGAIKLQILLKNPIFRKTVALFLIFYGIFTFKFAYQALF